MNLIRIAKEQEKQWLQREEEAQKQWKELQKRLEKIKEDRAKQNEKIRMEWEAEQAKIKQQIELKEKEEALKKEQRQKLEQRIEEFLQHGGDIPEELLTPLETNPNKPVCQFFKKTGSCRFGDLCSRNHIRPGVSRVLLIPNFFSHYSLQQCSESEYGNDLSLEFENYELYNHFKEFFYDVLPEMEKCGRVRQFKVCCNTESHLRGNVYIEYNNHRESIKSYKLFQGRWYGGKQLNVQFTEIESWKSAICGKSLKLFKKLSTSYNCYFRFIF